jgi:hypothetical protein
VKSAQTAAKVTPQLHENQAVSDVQLRAAGKLLQELVPTLVKNKQTKILTHTQKAIEEITIALKIR